MNKMTVPLVWLNEWHTQNAIQFICERPNLLFHDVHIHPASGLNVFAGTAEPS